jgi:hypothetical protein
MRVCVAASAVAVGLVCALLNARGRGVLINAMQMDGTFQTSSMMYRLSYGDMPGRDFLPYLGMGPMFMIYPGFVLMGRTVSASISSAFLMVLLVYAAGGTLIVALFRDERSYWRLTLLFATVLAGISALPRSVQDITVGNSLRPVRAALPYVCIGLFLIVMRHVVRPRLRYLLYGAIAGMALIWSNDFGLPTFAVVMALAVYEWRTRREGRQQLVLIVAGAVVSATVLMTVLTAGHPGALLQYNFKDVAGDQYRYFGTEVRANKIIEWRDLRIIRGQIALVMVVSVIALLARRRRYVVLAALGWAEFLGGFLALVGGHYDFGYMTAFEVWAEIVIALAVLRGIPGIEGRVLGFLKSLTTQSKVALYSVVMVVAVVMSARVYHGQVVKAKTDGFYVKELGGYVANDEAGLVAWARTSNEPLLEEYWGLPSAIRRERGPWRVDSAIAAMGSEREVAKASLRGWGGGVTTMHVGGFYLQSREHQVQTWAVNANWWLYGPVLRNYEPAMVTPNLIFWKKLDKPRVWPDAPCKVENVPAQRVDVGSDGGFYEMTLQYAVRSRRWHTSIMAETNTTTFQKSIYGFVSIDPKASEVTLPVYVSKDLPSGLLFQVYPANVRKDFVLLGCSAREIVDPPDGVLTKSEAGDFAQYKSREVALTGQDD